ncbi:MAG: hypothetical protein OXN83_03425, partial [Oligoflexia bacterium]|nr:hypothetical protein [Oligoflexia bacterium]
SLSSLYKLFPNFRDKVQAFDCINSKLIQKTEKNLQELQALLTKKEKKLIPCLKEWLHFLYWRKPLKIYGK